MQSLTIPGGVLEVVDRARRHCLWRRKDKDKIIKLVGFLDYYRFAKDKM
jgi:hypothetical protein